MNKKKVVVLMGGPSAEHEVSLNSGKMVLEMLDKKKHEALPVTISKNREWSFGKDDPLSTGAALDRLKKEKVDAVFIIMHGPYGEDGTIQGLLEFAEIPYTGSGVLASALGMDKVRSSEVFMSHDIQAPEFVNFTKNEWEKKKEDCIKNVQETVQFPCVVKPVFLGSSVGIKIVQDEERLSVAIKEALEHDREVMIQKYIKGTEVTCGVLDKGNGGDAIALPLTEIVPKSGEFFDYKAKYTKGASDEITPARVDEATTKKVQEAALKAHRVLGCSGFSRTDFILESPASDLQPPALYVLETNTIPGMTETSLLPQAALAAGISFSELLDGIIEAAENSH